MSAYACANSLVPQDINSDFIKHYSEKEKEAILEDMARIHGLVFPKNFTASPQKHYIATAGGPGSGKSTVLETFLASDPAYAAYIYIDPDQRTLRFMTGTYLSSMNLYEASKAASYHALLEENYSKWRGASNYIANSFLNEAVSKGLNIAHGTTSTSKMISTFYEKLAKAGYDINLLLCFSPLENCREAIQHRAHTQAFVQSSNEDAEIKYKQFFKSIPTYVSHAEVLYLYWIESFKKGAVHAATFHRIQGLVIVDQKAMECIQDLYKQLQKKDSSLAPLDQIFVKKLICVQDSI